MRLAALADIHGNLQALESVLDDIKRYTPDLILVAGDLINRFVQPREVLERLAQIDHIALHGNADLYAVLSSSPDWQHPWQPAVQIAEWNRRQIGEAWTTYLAQLPDYVYLSCVGESDVLVAHGLPGDPFHGIPSEVREAVWKERGEWPYGLARPEDVGNLFRETSARLFITAHTHRPYVRTIEGVTVVNPGAVMHGQMRDGGRPLADYVVCTWRGGDRQWEFEFRHVPFDYKTALMTLEAIRGKLPCIEDVIAGLLGETDKDEQRTLEGAYPEPL